MRFKDCLQLNHPEIIVCSIEDWSLNFSSIGSGHLRPQTKIGDRFRWILIILLFYDTQIRESNLRFGYHVWNKCLNLIIILLYRIWKGFKKVIIEEEMIFIYFCASYKSCGCKVYIYPSHHQTFPYTLFYFQSRPYILGHS